MLRITENRRSSWSARRPRDDMAGRNWDIARYLVATAIGGAILALAFLLFGFQQVHNLVWWMTLGGVIATLLGPVLLSWQYLLKSRQFRQRADGRRAIGANAGVQLLQGAIATVVILLLGLLGVLLSSASLWGLEWQGWGVLVLVAALVMYVLTLQRIMVKAEKFILTLIFAGASSFIISSFWMSYQVALINDRL